MKNKLAVLSAIAVLGMGVSMEAEAGPVNAFGQLAIIANVGNGDTNTSSITQNMGVENWNTGRNDNFKRDHQIRPANVNLSGQGAAIITIGNRDTNNNYITQQIGENSTDVNKAVSKGDTSTLKSANSYTRQVATKTLVTADSNAKGYAKTAQGNAEAQAQVDANNTQNTAVSISKGYTDSKVVAGDAATLKKANSYTNEQVTSGDVKTLATADSNAQDYASTAQGDAETYAQGAANTAQKNAINTSEGYTNGVAVTTLNTANATAQGDVNTLANSDAQSFTTNQLQVNGNSAVGGNETVGGTLTANGANMDNNVIQNLAAGTTGTDAANVNQVNNMGASTLQSANNYTNAQIAGANNFAQGAANQAQLNANQYAASGIAAALAMPSSPYLEPGHYAVGIQAATYGGEQGFGARATFQINDHWSANAGVAGGTGIYGQVGGTIGVQYQG